MNTTQDIDWKSYNKSLTQEISLIFNIEWKEVENNQGKGRPKVYPDSLIEQLSRIRHYFNLPYRQLEGFIRKLSSFLGLKKVPDYSTLCRRDQKLGLETKLSGKNQTVAIDSSGLKLIASGGWITRKHGKRKEWLKLHLAVDIESKEIVAWQITKGKVHDNKKFKALVKQSDPAKVLADGAYDSKENFNWLFKKGVDIGIKVRKNISPKAGGSIVRRNIGWKQKKDWDKWSKETEYGQRWQAETVFSLFKRRFGEWVNSRKLKSIKQEIGIKIKIHNELMRSRP